MRHHKKSLLAVLIQKYSFNNATKRVLNQIIDFLSISLLILLCIIDWDALLTNLGL